MSKYEGIQTLENLKEAANYNSFLEKELNSFIKSSQNILDFGAGNGEFSKRLSKYGLKIDCIETDPNLAAQLLAQGFEVFPNITESNKKYDKIYSLNVLEHIEDDITALRKIKESLNKDGQIFIYVPAFMVLYSGFDRKIGHYRRYTKKELVQKMEQVGFRIERAEYVDSLGFFAWLILKLLSGSEREPNVRLIKIYDSYFFPISRGLDSIFKKIFGKNLLVIAGN